MITAINMEHHFLAAFRGDSSALLKAQRAAVTKTEFIVLQKAA
jgi:hypothetical protein